MHQMVKLSRGEGWRERGSCSGDWDSQAPSQRHRLFRCGWEGGVKPCEHFWIPREMKEQVERLWSERGLYRSSQILSYCRWLTSSDNRILKISSVYLSHAILLKWRWLHINCGMSKSPVFSNILEKHWILKPENFRRKPKIMRKWLL